MRPIILTTIALTLSAALPAGAATFDRARIAPDQGLDVLSRGVARQTVGRDVFANPYAAVTLGSVDVYNVFPYVEARTFEIVSDPRWNRLVYGEAGQTLKAFDGAGTPVGPLREPRGMAVDERGRLYVADTGNDRIVVLDASAEFGEVTLTPAFEIRGLHGPYGVAYSDGGTPFVAGDDYLYVADTGRNRIALYSLAAGGATFRAELGSLGGGEGHFAGPMAITVGRTRDGSTHDVFVADAHSRRLVHLVQDGNALRWGNATAIGADLVTSLDTDQWGNVYAAAPLDGIVRKFSPSLEAVAELRDGLVRPRGFHVPFVTVNDHRFGRVSRVGQASGLAIEQWGDQSGMKLWNLGLEVSNVAFDDANGSQARFALTDHAAVTLELVDAATGRTLARREVGDLEAGSHAVAFDEVAQAGGSGERLLRVSAVSGYTDGPVATAQTRLPGSGTAAVTSFGLLGHYPNPAGPVTRIDFAVPSGAAESSLRIFDASGREIRSLGSGFAAGAQSVTWDGRDARGRDVPAGVYFYRLDAGLLRWTHKLVMVR